MKLRLHAGSLRLRLSQTEVARLRDLGRIQDAVVFSPGQEFVYSIETDESPEVTATLGEANIQVVIPTSMAAAWIESDRTGIEGSTGGLVILIEKDFQCLHRPPQPGDDSFPNPLADE